MLQMKRKSAGKNEDVAYAEVQVLQSKKNALGQKQTPDFKDENELFGDLIASQMPQIAAERKVVARYRYQILCIKKCYINERYGTTFRSHLDFILK